MSVEIGAVAVAAPIDVAGVSGGARGGALRIATEQHGFVGLTETAADPQAEHGHRRPSRCSQNRTSTPLPQSLARASTCPARRREAMKIPTPIAAVIPADTASPIAARSKA